MPFFARIPSRPDAADSLLQSEHYINLINGSGTLVQRELRRHGFGGYEPATASVALAAFQTIAEQKGSGGFGFFDVGANGGFYSVLCRALYRDSARVAAFEPAPDTVYWLNAINEVNRLGMEVQALALSDQETELVLYLSEKSDASNSLNPDFKARHKGTTTVRCTTLDRFCEENGFWPDILKIDVETHEEQVLRGGKSLIGERRPWLIMEAINKGGTDYGERIDSVLREVGDYHSYHIGPEGLERRTSIRSEPRTEHRDWLITPTPLDDRFAARVERWAEALAHCTPETTVAPGGAKKPKRKRRLPVPGPEGTVERDKVGARLDAALPHGSRRRRGAELLISLAELLVSKPRD